MDDPTTWNDACTDELIGRVLVDATQPARVLGYQASVALTWACWTKCVELREPSRRDFEMDRLWEVLRSLRNAMPYILEQPRVDFDVAVRTGMEAGELVRLKAVFEQWEDGERLITIMLASED